MVGLAVLDDVKSLLFELRSSTVSIGSVSFPEIRFARNPNTRSDRLAGYSPGGAVVEVVVEELVVEELVVEELVVEELVVVDWVVYPVFVLTVEELVLVLETVELVVETVVPAVFVVTVLEEVVELVVDVLLVVVGKIESQRFTSHFEVEAL